MKNLIAIVAGEPDSINSEIIAKSWKKIKNKENLIIIGSFLLLKEQIRKIGLKIKISKINTIEEARTKKNLNILDIPLKFTSVFKSSILDTRNYVLKSLDVAHNLASNKKIKAFINAPINKIVFKDNFLGVTEYLASKNNIKNKEVMMIYNKKLSVVPLTTHLEIKNITNKIKVNLIKSKIITLNTSYTQLFKKKAKNCYPGFKSAQ